ncbi:hypothetical protein [Saccharothrix variisporea]|uniref:hypothetical protein n=1 Tax=Saccharothrix variisporea TaxID=543527 RepID=UPI001FE67594|nr:hypothetical protein [Saccharothrix variisporea]
MPLVEVEPGAVDAAALELREVEVEVAARDRRAAVEGAQPQVGVTAGVPAGAGLDVLVVHGTDRHRRVHDHGVLGVLRVQEVLVGGEVQLGDGLPGGTGLARGDLHAHGDPLERLPRLLVPAGVPHLRLGHGPDHGPGRVHQVGVAVVLALRGSALGPQGKRQRHRPLGTLLQHQELLEPGPGRFHHEVRAGPDIREGGLATLELGVRQRPTPLEGDFGVTVLHGSEVPDVVGFATRGGDHQVTGVRLGGDGAVRALLEGQVDRHPRVPALDADRTGVDLGGELAVRVDEGGGVLGPLAERFDPDLVQRGGGPRGGDVRRLVAHRWDLLLLLLRLGLSGGRRTDRGHRGSGEDERGGNGHHPSERILGARRPGTGHVNPP